MDQVACGVQVDPNDKDDEDDEDEKYEEDTGEYDESDVHDDVGDNQYLLEIGYQPQPLVDIQDIDDVNL